MRPSIPLSPGRSLSTPTNLNDLSPPAVPSPGINEISYPGMVPQMMAPPGLAMLATNPGFHMTNIGMGGGNVQGIAMQNLLRTQPPPLLNRLGPINGLNPMTPSPAQSVNVGPPSYLDYLQFGAPGFFPYLSAPRVEFAVPPINAMHHNSNALPAAQRGPTVYLGRLTSDTDDVIVRQLLQECGNVVRWSRTTDPATKKLSSFGFCEFESPLGVTRAVRCLNGLILDGQSLVANCEDKVKEGLNQWRNDRKNKLLEENPAKTMQEIEQEIEREESRIQQTTQRIAGEWNAKIHLLKAEQMVKSAENSTKPHEPQEDALDGSLNPASSVEAPNVPSNQVKTPSSLSEYNIIRKTSEEKPNPPSTVTRKSLEDGKESSNEAKFTKQAEKSVAESRDAITKRRHEYLDNLNGFVHMQSSSISMVSTREASRIKSWNARVKDDRVNLRKRIQAWEQKEEFLYKQRQKHREELAALRRNPCMVSSSQKRRLIEWDMKEQIYYLGPKGEIVCYPLTSRKLEERLHLLAKERDEDLADKELELKEKEELKNARVNEAISKNSLSECAISQNATSADTISALKGSKEELSEELAQSTDVLNEKQNVSENYEMSLQTCKQNPSLKQSKIGQEAAQFEISSMLGESKFRKEVINENTRTSNNAEDNSQPVSLISAKNNANLPGENVSNSEIDKSVKETASSSQKVEISALPIKISLSVSSGSNRRAANHNLSTTTAGFARTNVPPASVQNIFLGLDEEDDEFDRKRNCSLPKLDTSDTAKKSSSGKNSTEGITNMVKKIASLLPKTTEELFAYPIDWDLLQNNNIFETKVNPWINNKVIEFLGEEETELTAFIATQISLRPKPELFLHELKEFLDEEAEGFVAKLWKLLVFEVLRLNQNNERPVESSNSVPNI